MRMEEWIRQVQQQRQNAQAAAAKFQQMEEAAKVFAEIVGPDYEISITPIPTQSRPQVPLYEVARQALEQAGKPLRIEPLAERVSRLVGTDVTPESVEGVLNKHIRYRAQTPFTRPQPRTYGLKIWKQDKLPPEEP